MMAIPSTLQNRLKSCRALPSVPAVALNILDLCEQDDVQLSQVAAALARDPALAAKVLRVANSALFSVRSPVTTLDRAVSILGINSALSLSLSFTLVSTFHRSRGKGFDHSIYWRRAVISAIAAKTLGTWKNPSLRDELFVGGLLQDIGMLVLNEADPETYARICAASQLSHLRLLDLEREAFGADHAAVGAWLLERWNVPERLRLPVAASHSAEFSSEPEIIDFCRALCLAGLIGEIWTNPETGAAATLAQQYAFHELQISPERFGQLLAEIAELIPEVTSNLEVDVGGDEMVNRILDQAREALVVLNLQSQQQVQVMHGRAMRDGFISLYNRTYLEDVLPKFFEAARRGNQPLSAIFADIDHFKTINDSYGHQAGDDILRAVAGIFASVLRSSDVVSRYGGDEFVCLLPDTDKREAKTVAERILSTIAATHYRIAENAEISITISLGCATFSSSHHFNDGPSLLKEADRCLYASKRSGRNRLVVSDELNGDWEAHLSTAAQA